MICRRSERQYSVRCSCGHHSIVHEGWRDDCSLLAVLINESERPCLICRAAKAREAIHKGIEDGLWIRIADGRPDWDCK